VEDRDGLDEKDERIREKGDSHGSEGGSHG
jgi:hypothetical protein